MSPQDIKVQELESRIQQLEDIIGALYSTAGFDPLIAKAVTGVLSSASTKTPASATRAVNESGAGTYSVMFPPSGFIKIGTYNVPYIT